MSSAFITEFVPVVLDFISKVPSPLDFTVTEEALYPLLVIAALIAFSIIDAAFLASSTEKSVPAVPSHFFFNAVLSASDNLDHSTLTSTPSTFITSSLNAAPEASAAVVVNFADVVFDTTEPVVELLVDEAPSGPDCEPSSNFIVLNSVVSEILVSSL